MKMAIKYSAIFWTSLLVLIVYGCSHPVAAAERTLTFECNGERLVFNQHDKNPIILEVVRERGTWMQIPQDVNKTFQIFYNLDNGKVIKVGKNYAGNYYAEFFANADYANAFKPERTLSCRPTKSTSTNG